MKSYFQITLGIVLFLIAIQKSIAQSHVPVISKWNGADSLKAVEEINIFRQKLNDEYRNRETTPLGPDVFPVFTTHSFFPINLIYRVIARLEVTPETPYFGMKTTTTRVSTERIYGYLNFTLAGKVFRMPVYQSKELSQNPKYTDYLFFPFTDDTNGSETYAGGRYLDLRVPKEGESLIVDFNMAYNPYCAYHSAYSCPIVPAENTLDISVRAGVLYHEEHKSDAPKRWPEKRNNIDVVPEYPGGAKALAELLRKNLRYPKAARKQRIEGTVFVEFTVEADGSVTNIKTLKGISRECDEAAERVIGLMKKWKPGELNGQAVPSRVVQPINFRL